MRINRPTRQRLCTVESLSDVLYSHGNPATFTTPGTRHCTPDAGQAPTNVIRDVTTLPASVTSQLRHQ